MLAYGLQLKTSATAVLSAGEVCYNGATDIATLASAQVCALLAGLWAIGLHG